MKRWKALQKLDEARMRMEDLKSEVSAELREEFKPVYCKECAELWQDCLCPKGEAVKVCPEPWMERI